MGYHVEDFKEIIDKLPKAFEKAMEDRDIDEELKGNLDAAFSEMLPGLKKIQQAFTIAEKKEKDVIGKFNALSEEKQIALIEAALPDYKICPISQINEYIKNELNGNCLRFMRAVEGKIDNYNTHYFTIVNNKKFFIVYPESYLVHYMSYDEVIDYLAKHPDALEP